MLFRQAWNYYLSLAVVVLLSLTVTQVSAAGSGNNLYEVWVSVADQSSASRQQAFQQAFDGVIKKLTGNSALSKQGTMASARQQAATFVNQYNYREQPANGQALASGEYLMQVRFSESAINKLLRDHQLPIWGENRPSLLVWIAQDNQGQRTIVAPQEPSVIRNDITFAARSWGIPVLYPVMDFEDSSALPISDLWGLFQAPITKASQRYGASAILALRVWPSDASNWSGQAMFVLNGRAYSQSYEHVSPAMLAEAAMTEVAKQMSDLYALKAGASPNEPVYIVVNGVDSVGEYADMLKYFDGLTAIRSAIPVQISGSQVMLGLLIDGTVQQLVGALDSGKRMNAAAKPDTSDATGVRADWNAELYYNWR